jgi:hypothetical protein
MKMTQHSLYGSNYQNGRERHTWAEKHECVFLALRTVKRDLGLTLELFARERK